MRRAVNACVDGPGIRAPHALLLLLEAAIYSRSDGIVAWQWSVNEVEPQVENIEIHASHVGMGMNPFALYANGDRLAQDPSHWRAFDAGGLRRWFFKTDGAARPRLA